MSDPAAPGATSWPGFEADRVTTRAGHDLHVERRGTGGPTVVLEAGMGASRNTWGAVAPLLTPSATVVAYDRAGVGRSAPASGARDLASLAADLVDVLDHVGGHPFVLVGHSWGGPIVRQVAADRPEVVGGLVLVDPTDERCDLFFSKANERQTAFALRFGPLLARTGLVRVGVKRLARHLPEPAATDLVAEDTTPAAMEAQAAELRSCTADLRRLRDRPLVLPRVPYVVISGTRTSLLERGRRPALVESHRAGAAAEPLGRHVAAEASSHYVPFTEPELIAAEILDVLRSASADRTADRSDDRPQEEP